MEALGSLLDSLLSATLWFDFHWLTGEATPAKPSFLGISAIFWTVSALAGIFWYFWTVSAEQQSDQTTADGHQCQATNTRLATFSFLFG